MVDNKDTAYKSAIAKEMKLLLRQEDALRRMAVKTTSPKWKAELTEKVPEKIYVNLQKAFCKAFAIIFEKGTGIIEKTYDRSAMEEDRMIQEFAFEIKANRKTLKKFRKDVGAVNRRNMAITSAEGIGLGALGIGLPDIVIFVGILLKGIYEVAVRYGFSYDLPEERSFILKLMEVAMLKGEDWELGNAEINQCINVGVKNYDWKQSKEEMIDLAANAFAVDMVLLKFIQGFPVVGIIGGVANPVYYNKVMKYVELKYRKRYLLALNQCNKQT